MKESIKKEFHFLFSFKFSQLRNGKGHYTFLNGVEYTGDYVENKKHGFAKVTYKKYGTYFGNSHSFNYLSFQVFMRMEEDMVKERLLTKTVIVTQAGGNTDKKVERVLILMLLQE